MSILSFPRLNFKGVFSTNPCTCNNDDVMPDIVERDIDSFGDNPIFQQPDSNVQEYLNEMVALDNYGSSSPTPTNFMRSGWNLYGNHSTFFENTTITSAVVGPSTNQKMNQPSDDPIIGQAFRILGSPTEDPSRRGTPMIVDLDSTGLITTQLYIGGIEFGDSQNPITTISADTRAYQDWLNFNSTVGPYGGEQNFVGIGCMMQFVIPPSALPSPSNINSPTLNALITAGQQNNGLVIRFRIYECEPQLTDEELNAEFSQGNQVHNPALGYLVGTIGVQYASEAASEPAGPGLRKLSAPYPRPVMYYQGNSLNPNPTPLGSIPPAQMPYASAPALIGNMVASFLVTPGSTTGIVSLDMISCFPKDGFRHPNGPNGSGDGFDVARYMAYVGDMQLAYNPINTSDIIPICNIDYATSNYSNYEDFGGIVDIPFDITLYPGIQVGNLCLVGQQGSPLNPGIIMLSEEVIRIVTDDRAVYLEQDQSSPYSKYSIGIQVYQWGGPTKYDTTLYLNEYANIIQVQPPTPSPPMDYRPNQTVGTDSPAKLNFASIVTIPAGQGYDTWFPISIQTKAAGAVVLHYSLDQNWDNNYTPSVPAWSTECYSSIRVYEDSTSQPPVPSPITWDYVYQNILRFYYLIYPFMSSVIPLNQADSIQNPFWSQKILDRLNTLSDGSNFFATTNMPVTRTMPPWKVNVLKQFINQASK